MTSVTIPVSIWRISSKLPFTRKSLFCAAEFNEKNRMVTKDIAVNMRIYINSI